MFDNLRSTLKNRDGNDYKPEHTGKRKRHKDAGTGTAVDLPVGRKIRFKFKTPPIPMKEVISY